VKIKWVAIVAVGLLVAFGITFFSPLASSHPDGLEKVADDKGFLDKGEGPDFEIIPDYTFPGVEDENLATILSGIIGVAIVAALGFGVGFALRLLVRSRREQAQSPGPFQESG
jgi:hypothetical protein